MQRVRLHLFGLTALLAILFTWSVDVPTWAADLTLQLRGRLEGSGGDMIRFSPDGSTIFTAGGGAGRIWDAKTLTPVGNSVTHNSDVAFARFSTGGQELVTGTDGGIRWWNARTAEEVLPSLELKQMFERSSVSGDGRYIAGVLPPEKEDAADVAVVETRSGRRVASVRCGAHAEFILLNEDGSKLVIVLERGTHERGFLIWDVRQGRAVCPELRTEYDYRADMDRNMGGAPRLIPAAFSPDGKQVAVCDNNFFRVCDASSGRSIERSPARDDMVLIDAVGFTADGRQVIVFDSSGISGWNAADGTRTKPGVGGGIIACYDVSADGKRVAVVTVRFGELGGELNIWDWSEARLLCATKVNDGSVVAFSADGRSVAVGGEKSGETVVWRIE